MRTTLLTGMIFLTSCLAQKPLTKDAKLEAQIIALERSGWEAWKNKDSSWFRYNTTDEFISINAAGISNKEQVIRSTATDCNVTSVALDHIRFILLNENAVALTYTVVQEGECGGKKLSKVRATATYVKRNGKWLEALYTEMEMTE